MTTIAQGFDEYEREVIPADAGLTQRVESKRAFYAGAWCVLCLLAEACDDDDVDEDALGQYMDALEAEIGTFVALTQAAGTETRQ